MKETEEDLEETLEEGYEDWVGQVLDSTRTNSRKSGDMKKENA